MDTPDIKAGTYYNLKLLCVLSKDKLIAFESPSGRYMTLRQCDLECVSPITPSEPPTSVGPAPKHAPCRLFKKGDKVRVVEWKGRNYCDRDHDTELHTGCFAEIWEDEKDEQEEGYVSVIYQEYIRYVPPCYLELVTPVVEPYCIADHIHGWIVYKDTPGNVVANFNKTHPHAKAAAEAERDRLNAEYRKENLNDY